MTVFFTRESSCPAGPLASFRCGFGVYRFFSGSAGLGADADRREPDATPVRFWQLSRYKAS